MTIINTEPGLTSGSQPNRDEREMFRDPRPGEDGTPYPPVLNTEPVLGMPKYVKDYWAIRIAQNAAIAAARGIVDKAADNEVLAIPEAEDADHSDDEVDVEPVSSVHEDIGYRRYRKKPRGSRGGAKVQAARARQQTRAQEAARIHEAETERLNHRPIVIEGSPDAPTS